MAHHVTPRIVGAEEVQFLQGMPRNCITLDSETKRFKHVEACSQVGTSSHLLLASTYLRQERFFIRSITPQNDRFRINRKQLLRLPKSIPQASRLKGVTKRAPSFSRDMDSVQEQEK